MKNKRLGLIFKKTMFKKGINEKKYRKKSANCQWLDKDQVSNLSEEWQRIFNIDDQINEIHHDFNSIIGQNFFHLENKKPYFKAKYPEKYIYFYFQER